MEPGKAKHKDFSAVQLKPSPFNIFRVCTKDENVINVNDTMTSCHFDVITKNENQIHCINKRIRCLLLATLFLPLLPPICALLVWIINSSFNMYPYVLVTPWSPVNCSNNSHIWKSLTSCSLIMFPTSQLFNSASSQQECMVMPISVEASCALVSCTFVLNNSANDSVYLPSQHVMFFYDSGQLSACLTNLNKLLQGAELIIVTQLNASTESWGISNGFNCMNLCNASETVNRSIFEYVWITNVTTLTAENCNKFLDFATSSVAVPVVVSVLLISFVFMNAFLCHKKMTSKDGAIVELLVQSEDLWRRVYLELEENDRLLHEMLPTKVAALLKRDETVDPEFFMETSVCFGDMPGFNYVAMYHPPISIVFFLNSVFSAFDECVRQFDVYKVETIGDSYILASGLWTNQRRDASFSSNHHGDITQVTELSRDGNDEKATDHSGDHATKIADAAIQLLVTAKEFQLPGECESLPLRIGINSGSIVAGVIGNKNPRYCLFGDTVNIASRMCSAGQAYSIHCSEEFRTQRSLRENYVFEPRGVINVKGKGPMSTYWLI